MRDVDAQSWKDPVLAEIRKIRTEHARKFGCDLATMVEDLRRFEREQGLEPLGLEPKRKLDKTGS